MLVDVMMSGCCAIVAPFQGFHIPCCKSWGFALRAPPQAITLRAFSPVETSDSKTGVAGDSRIGFDIMPLVKDKMPMLIFEAPT